LIDVGHRRLAASTNHVTRKVPEGARRVSQKASTPQPAAKPKVANVESKRSGRYSRAAGSMRRAPSR
jgi:hypothetical protein